MAGSARLKPLPVLVSPNSVSTLSPCSESCRGSLELGDGAQALDEVPRRAPKCKASNLTNGRAAVPSPPCQREKAPSRRLLPRRDAQNRTLPFLGLHRALHE